MNHTTHPDRYAVMGHPIAHSRSPIIHTTFAQQTGQIMRYDALLVGTEEGQFAQAVNDFRAQGGKGLNVTVPFKQIAWRFVDQCNERAQRAQAVNTIWFDPQGRCIGDNTDGIGLVRDVIQNHGYCITKKRLLILGAGGAVRGILFPLLQEKPLLCVIANRTFSKAQELVEEISLSGILTHASSYETLAGQSFDLIINGTSASLQGQLPPLPEGLLAPGGWCYDMMYAACATPFMQWGAKQKAARTLDGLGMLVEQAAEAFYLWRGIRPQTQAVIQQVRTHLITSTKSSLEVGGPSGPEPTRYGDWEKKGRCIDF